jgi:hypothetical protein
MFSFSRSPWVNKGASCAPSDPPWRVPDTLAFLPFRVFFSSCRSKQGMAWFYNLILSPFFEIGLVAQVPRHSGPAATMVLKFAFSLGNSRFSQNSSRKKPKKTSFSLASSTRPILPILAFAKRQFGRY